MKRFLAWLADFWLLIVLAVMLGYWLSQQYALGNELERTQRVVNELCEDIDEVGAGFSCERAE